MQVDDVVGAAFLLNHRQLLPHCRRRSPRARADERHYDFLREGVTVTGVEVAEPGGARRCHRGRPCRLRKDSHLRRPTAGSRVVGRLAGVNVPRLRSSISTSSPRRWPARRQACRRLRDPDRLTYWKEEVGGLVMGGYQHNSEALAVRPAARGFRVSASAAGLGSFRADHGAGFGARARPA